ncbi:MAG: hypothetical protein AAFY34_16305 [Pseudomonadota bacterium]
MMINRAFATALALGACLAYVPESAAQTVNVESKQSSRSETWSSKTSTTSVTESYSTSISRSYTRCGCQFSFSFNPPLASLDDANLVNECEFPVRLDAENLCFKFPDNDEEECVSTSPSDGFSFSTSSGNAAKCFDFLLERELAKQSE